MAYTEENSRGACHHSTLQGWLTPSSAAKMLRIRQGGPKTPNAVDTHRTHPATLFETPRHHVQQRMAGSEELCDYQAFARAEVLMPANVSTPPCSGGVFQYTPLDIPVYIPVYTIVLSERHLGAVDEGICSPRSEHRTPANARPGSRQLLVWMQQCMKGARDRHKDSSQ
jgi:hypothetical protein